MMSLTSSNKSADTNISIKYRGISCKKFGTSEVTAWYSGDSTKISSFIILLNCYCQRSNRKPVLINIIAWYGKDGLNSIWYQAFQFDNNYSG